MTHLSPWTSLKASFPIRKSEWSAAGLVLGMWVVLTFNRDLFLSSPGYLRMAAYAPQNVWAWACFVVGFGRMAVLFVNGHYWRTPHWRAFAAFLSCLLWYQMALALAPTFGVGLVFALWAFVLDVLNFRQAFSEAAVSEGLKSGERRRHPVRH